MKRMMKLFWNIKSVQSIHPGKSLPGRPAGVIQTIYDIAKAHGGVPIAIGMKVASKEGEARPPVPVGTGMTQSDGEQRLFFQYL